MKLTTSHFTNAEGFFDPCEIDLVEDFTSINVSCPYTINSKFAVVVRDEKDLETLPERLFGDVERAVMYTFSPVLISKSASLGFFPMTCLLPNDLYLYVVLVDLQRCVCFLDKNLVVSDSLRACRTKQDETHGGVFREERISVHKKLLKAPDEALRTASLKVFMNREEDLLEVFQMVHAQHGENWISQPFRLCLYRMFKHREDFEMKIVLTAIRRHSYNTEKSDDTTKKKPTTKTNGEGNHANHGLSQNSSSHPPSNAGERAEIHCSSAPDETTIPIQEGQLVACEIGYLIGDIYTSISGAYCLNGTGLLQLRLTAHIMKECGCKVWDLGMELEYKKRHLGTILIPREEWLKLVAERRKEGSSARIYEQVSERYGQGVEVRRLVTR